MKYIGCDFHPSFQQIAMLDKETGEMVERRLLHTEEARAFYEGLEGAAVKGVEASGNMDGLESLLAGLGQELWIGDAAAIARQEGRKQKHDRRSAALILQLMLENRFPKIWIPTLGETRSAAVADASSASGTDAGTDQEPAAAYCLEPGLAEEAQAVE